MSVTDKITPHKSFSFTVPGKPEPWKRARKMGKRHFNDPSMTAFQDLIAWHAVAARIPCIESGAVKLCLDWLDYGQATERMVVTISEDDSGIARVRCDIDNVSKNYGDALSKVLYHDDAQITNLSIKVRK